MIIRGELPTVWGERVLTETRIEDYKDFHFGNDAGYCKGILFEQESTKILEDSLNPCGQDAYIDDNHPVWVEKWLFTIDEPTQRSPEVRENLSYHIASPFFQLTASHKKYLQLLPLQQPVCAWSCICIRFTLASPRIHGYLFLRYFSLAWILFLPFFSMHSCGPLRGSCHMALPLLG